MDVTQYAVLWEMVASKDRRKCRCLGNGRAYSSASRCIVQDMCDFCLDTQYAVERILESVGVGISAGEETPE